MLALRRPIRRRQGRHLERGLRPPRSWRVDLRVANDERWIDAVLDLYISHKIALCGIDPHPPAAGPEVEISILALATSAELAERYGRRQFERAGLHVLAVRSASVSAAAPG
jgi:hypothetical protein